jgi:hypothetical protein
MHILYERMGCVLEYQALNVTGQAQILYGDVIRAYENHKARISWNLFVALINPAVDGLSIHSV